MKTLKEALSMNEALFSRKNLRLNPYGLTKDDLKGDLKGFPMGVVVRMLEEQELQGNIPDVKVFCKNRNNDGEHSGGFNWDDTEARFDFWFNIISFEEWDKFFERYPAYKIYNL